MTRCVNLCEIALDRCINDVVVLNKLKDIVSGTERIYVGSYFCSQYFLFFDFEKLNEFAKQINANITLVIPIFSEKDIVVGKEKIRRILEINNMEIDEITVNDYGMLNFISQIQGIKINLGRLFFKEARDTRMVDFYNRKGRIKEVCVIENEIDLSRINCIEIDEICSEIVIDCKINVAIHEPFCYLTTGNICKFASIHKKIDRKFRPNDRCSQNCGIIYERYINENEIEGGELYRIGRTIYSYMKSRSRIKNVERDVYFPFFEIVNFLEDYNENSCTAK